MITYNRGDLFAAPLGSILTHACNAQGVWGSGIAKTFKDKFPLAYEEYAKFCLRTLDKRTLVGECLLIDIPDSMNYKIACLITSCGYGKYVDEPAQILQATSSSFSKLIQLIDSEETIHMPKINSLRFKTPWDQTEKCIESLLYNSNKQIKCVVWEQ